MHSHEWGLCGGDVAHGVDEVLFTIEQRSVRVGGEVTMLGGNRRFGKVLNQLLASSAVQNEISDGDQLQIVLVGERTTLR